MSLLAEDMALASVAFHHRAHCVNVNRQVLERAGLKRGDRVIVQAVDGRLVIRKIALGEIEFIREGGSARNK